MWKLSFQLCGSDITPIPKVSRHNAHTALPQSHSRPTGVAGCCSRELGVSREVELLVSSHLSFSSQHRGRP